MRDVLPSRLGLPLMPMIFMMIYYGSVPAATVMPIIVVPEPSERIVAEAPDFLIENLRCGNGGGGGGATMTGPDVRC
jgi:hypothetical protein